MARLINTTESSKNNSDVFGSEPPEDRHQKSYGEFVKNQNRIPKKHLVQFSSAPSATLSFHQENSVIAEGLVLLRGRILDSSVLAVLCFQWSSSGGFRYVFNSV